MLTTAFIVAPVKQELAEFERRFRHALSSNIALVDVVVRYIVHRKGKRVRPILVLLSAGACGGITDATFRGAALVELLHTATLVHDDVVDDATTRRGFASVNAIWKNKIAVLIGDYILSRGLLLSLEGNDFTALRITSQAVRRMSEGELLQIQKTRQLNTDEATYFRIIRDKTASLLSTCCEIGARSATSDETAARALRDYGENLGIAFQIRDDILDFLGTESLIGKPIGGDLKEKKFTLPLIHAFSRAPAKTRRSILRLLKDGVDRGAIRTIAAFVKEYGGIDYATAKASAYSDEAVQALSPLRPSPYVASLERFARYVVERTK
ncbi:MAG: polyprenyl synthetase family protein [Bacteroidota bacterium]|nr:polyprenyl synthetase family protein [Bacteroidota bacterium]